MTHLTLLSSIAALILSRPLHGTAPASPVPHWVVLLVSVPALWLGIGATVIAIDRLLRRFGI